MASSKPSKKSVSSTTTTITPVEPSASLGASGVSAVGGATAPPAAASALSTKVPTITIPPIPSGFTPVSLREYLGTHPRTGQLAAGPDAVIELTASTTYTSTFGTTVPAASQVAAHLSTALGWTNLRVDLENFLVYVKSLEAITWKLAMSDLDKLNAIFQVVVKQNPDVQAEFPALASLLDVPKTIGERAAAARARKAKAKKAGTAAAPSTTTVASQVGAAATPVATAAPAAAPAATTSTGH